MYISTHVDAALSVQIDHRSIYDTVLVLACLRERPNGLNLGHRPCCWIDTQLIIISFPSQPKAEAVQQFMSFAARVKLFHITIASPVDLRYVVFLQVRLVWCSSSFLLATMSVKKNF